MSELTKEGAWLELFVPGRVCLLGEHSDWAGGFRGENPDITEGYCLVCGTDQGIYARVRRHRGREVKLRSTDERGRVQETSLQMSSTKLLATAKEGGFFSYAAGVVYQVLAAHGEAVAAGLEIDNYRTDLPLSKGLSSSAAMCVLVARAFNQVYGLRLSLRGEMELAYQGEITTPSQCGRMDQCCAFGQVPVFMTFDGDSVTAEQVYLPPGAALHYVVVDMLAKKDTTGILSSLRRAYPFAPPAPASDTDDNEVVEEEEAHRDRSRREERAICLGVRAFLGPANKRLLAEARAALEGGDAAALGRTMGAFQAAFDAALAPACPEQLTAPVLHRCLAHPPLQPHIFGAKGIGSQGDGSALFLCKSKADQDAVIAIVHAPPQKTKTIHGDQIPGENETRCVDGLGMKAFPLTITAGVDLSHKQRDERPAVVV